MADERLEARGVIWQNRGWGGVVHEEVTLVGGRSLHEALAHEGRG